MLYKNNKIKYFSKCVPDKNKKEDKTALKIRPNESNQPFVWLPVMDNNHIVIDNLERKENCNNISYDWSVLVTGQQVFKGRF